MDSFMGGFGLGITIGYFGIIDKPYAWIIPVIGLGLVAMGFFAPTPNYQKCQKESKTEKGEQK